jgi:hypothetical protein
MKYPILYGLLFNAIMAFGQKDTANHKTALTEYDKHLYLAVGIVKQKQLMGEVGLLYGKWFHEHSGVTIGMSGMKVSTEFNFQSKNFTIAPKVGYEFAILYVGGKLSLMDYTNFTYHDFKLTPEIGLTSAGYMGVYYGINIPITKSHLDNVSLHKFSLMFNLDKFYTLGKGKK